MSLKNQWSCGLPWSYINDVIDLSPQQLWRHIDVKTTSSRRHFTKGLSKTFYNSVVTTVTDLWRHWCRSMADSTIIENLVKHGKQCPNFQWRYKLKFFQTNNFLKSFNSLLVMVHKHNPWKVYNNSMVYFQVKPLGLFPRCFFFFIYLFIYFYLILFYFIFFLVGGWGSLKRKNLFHPCACCTYFMVKYSHARISWWNIVIWGRDHFLYFIFHWRFGMFCKDLERVRGLPDT